MHKSNDKISNGQMMAILINIVIGVGILSLPRSLSESMKTDGWVLLIISGTLAILLITIMTTVAKRYSGKTMMEFGERLVTRPITVLFSIIYLVYILIFAAFVVRIFGEIAKMYLLSQTPIEFIIITMLLVCTYLARSGIESIGRFAVIIIPIVIFPVFLMGIVLLPNMDFTNILPVFQFKFMDLIKAIPDTVFSFGGFEVVLIFTAFVDKPAKSLKYNIGAIVTVLVIYIYVFITSLLVFGYTELTHLIWPAMSLMETIEFPGAFLENVQGVVMAQWVLVVFLTLTPLIYGGALILSKIFKGKEHNYFVLPLVPIIFILALVPDNLPQAYDFITKTSYYLGTAVIVVIPIILFLVSLFRKNKKKGVSKNG